MRCLSPKVVWFLFILSAISCSDNKEGQYVAFSEKKINLITKDSLLFLTDSLPIGVVTKRYNFDGAFVLPDISQKVVHVFDKKAKLIGLISNASLKNGILPKSMPCSSTINGDTLMLLYSREKVIYYFTITGKFIKKTYLRMPDLETTVEAFAPIFHYDTVSKSFFISINDNPADNLQSYKSASLIGKFDDEGNFVHKFGKYPDYYSKGYFFPVLTYSAFCQEGKVYVMFAFDNKISEYDYDGSLTNEYILSERDLSERIEMKQAPVIKITDGKIAVRGRFEFAKVLGKKQFYTAEYTRNDGECLISVFDFEQMNSGSLILKGDIIDFERSERGALNVYTRRDEDILLTTYLIRE
jgi:hypothetical protein